MFGEREAKVAESEVKGEGRILQHQVFQSKAAAPVIYFVEVQSQMVIIPKWWVAGPARDHIRQALLHQALHQAPRQALARQMEFEFCHPELPSLRSRHQVARRHSVSVSIHVLVRQLSNLG